MGWSVKVGRGWASPVCDSKVLILHERDGEKEVLRAMDSSSGKESWRFSYRSGYQDSFGMEDGPRSTPAISGGLVVSHGPQGLVHAVSMEDGSLRWKVDLSEKFSSPKVFSDDVPRLSLQGARRFSALAVKIREWLPWS